MDIVFHYPPALLQLLIETVPKLCRSKVDVVLFFRGAGVGSLLTADVERRVQQDPKRISKFEITRTVLTRLNERGEETLAQRREVLKRVTEFEDFSLCWPNDALEARGLVSQVRELVNVRDSFTRMRQERDAEVATRRATRLAETKKVEEKRLAIEVVSRDLAALYGLEDAHARGKRLEGVLSRVFAVSGILVREAFELTGASGEGVVEQIDGAVALDGELYLVEMKWWRQPLGPAELAQHLTRVFARADARGIMISESGFTPAGIAAYREALRQRTVVLCELKEIVFALERGNDIAELFRNKVRAAILDKNPLARM